MRAAPLSQRTRRRLDAALADGRIRYWRETPSVAGSKVWVTMIDAQGGGSARMGVRDTRNFLSSGMPLGAYKHAVQ